MRSRKNITIGVKGVVGTKKINDEILEEEIINGSSIG